MGAVSDRNGRETEAVGLLDERIFRPALREAVRAPASLITNCVRQLVARDAKEAVEAQAVKIWKADSDRR